jgi:hypothetical protein
MATEMAKRQAQANSAIPTIVRHRDPDQAHPVQHQISKRKM